MKRTFQMIMISMCLAAASLPLMADGQGWLNNSATFKIDARWSLKLTNEARHHEVTFKDSFLKNWQAGLVYRLPGNIYASVLYKRESTDKPLFVLAENRFTLETGWKTGLAENLDFDVRFRTEIRRYDDKMADNHLRFRLRVRLRTKLTIGALKISPFVGTEPFGDTLADGINRNRFYLGAVFPMGEHAGLVINYIRQDTKGREALHVINSGINLSF